MISTLLYLKRRNILKNCRGKISCKHPGVVIKQAVYSLAFLVNFKSVAILIQVHCLVISGSENLEAVKCAHRTLCWSFWSLTTAPV